MRRWLLTCTSLMLALVAGTAGAQGSSAQQQQKALDKAAFAEVERALQSEAFGDVQSVVVLQRGPLASMGSSPAVLVMTASPFPLTLALTECGDMEVSVIRGLPPGRQPIKTMIK